MNLTPYHLFHHPLHVLLLQHHHHFAPFFQPCLYKNHFSNMPPKQTAKLKSKGPKYCLEDIDCLLELVEEEIPFSIAFPLLSLMISTLFSATCVL